MYTHKRRIDNIMTLKIGSGDPILPSGSAGSPDPARKEENSYRFGLKRVRI
jgi:hypothetical protein